MLVHNKNEDCIFQALNAFIRRFTVLYNSVLVLIRSEAYPLTTMSYILKEIQ